MIMMVMMPAQIHDFGTVTKSRIAVKGERTAVML
jgi:hypothetical protein